MANQDIVLGHSTMRNKTSVHVKCYIKAYPDTLVKPFPLADIHDTTICQSTHFSANFQQETSLRVIKFYHMTIMTKKQYSLTFSQNKLALAGRKLYFHWDVLRGTAYKLKKPK